MTAGQVLYSQQVDANGVCIISKLYIPGVDIISAVHNVSITHCMSNIHMHIGTPSSLTFTKAVTLVSDGIEGAFANEHQLFACQGSWLYTNLLQ